MTTRRPGIFGAVIAAALLSLVAGCSSSSSPSGAAAAVSNTAGATDTTTSAASDSVTPTTGAGTPPAAAGGGATTFCGAFKELNAANESAGSIKDAATLGATFRAAASDMRSTAPAAIDAAANTYADVIDGLGQQLQSGNLSKSDFESAFTSGLAGKAKDIGVVAIWVGKNCKL